MTTVSTNTREASCLRVALPRAVYQTIGPRQYISEKDICVSILIRVEPSIDLRPFLDTVRLHADLADASLDIMVEGQESLEYIGNIVAQYLTRKTVLYATTATESEPDQDSEPETDSDPLNLRDHLPPILVHRSSLLFAVRAWPSEKGSLLVADDILVDDMMILQDWDSVHEFVTSPGMLTLYCVLGSVRVLMPDHRSL